MPPSPSVTDQERPASTGTRQPPDPLTGDRGTEDPLLQHRSRSLRFWITLAVLTTLLAVVIGVLAYGLARQESWTPIPIPTATPGF